MSLSRTFPFIVFVALLAMPLDFVFAFQNEVVPVRSLEGEEVPLALCVQAFLNARVLVGTVEEKRLRRDSFVDDEEWKAIRSARMATQQLYAGITAEHDRHISEDVEPLEKTDYDGYVAAWDEAGLQWLRQRIEGLARIYAGLLDALDATTEAALEEYVQPGVCAGRAVAYHTDQEEFDPDTLATFEDFERLVEENRK